VFGVRVRLLRTVLVFVQWFRIKIGLGLSTEADVRDGGFQGSGVRGGNVPQFLHATQAATERRLSTIVFPWKFFYQPCRRAAEAWNR